MNARENTDCLIRKKKAERVGFFDAPWTDTIEKWRKEGHLLEKDPETGEDKPVDPGDYFGFDMVGVAGWFNNLPKKSFYELVDESDEWKVVRDGAGAVLKTWKYKSGTPEHIDFHMTTREIWENEYRSYLLEVDPERVNLPMVRQLFEKYANKDKWTVAGDMFIWELMRKSMGDICMFESLILDPEWIKDFNRVYTDFYKAHYKLIFDEVGTPDGAWIYDDLGYKNGLFCRPSILEELVFPYYKEIVDFFHSYDIPVVFHTCGGIEEAIPLIIDAGFDALNPMEVKAGCNAYKFAEQYGDKLAFIGGLDARILESGDKDLIRKEVTTLVKNMKSIGASYFFGSDHSISPNVEFDDFVYAIEVYREHMMY
jgi:uroporphyrinogen decarboxylase